MKTADFDYALPPDRIAQTPAEPRDAARLLVLPRRAGPVRHAFVHDLPEWLAPGDLLVVNDTRVIPARMAGRREPTGGAVEVFFCEPLGADRWAVLLRARRRPRPGERIRLGNGRAAAVLVENLDLGRAVVAVESPVPVADLLEAEGQTPLPPYIRRRAASAAQTAADRQRYQTVYAAVPGAVAAPTAGLHFTPELLRTLEARGIGRVALTLHVGPGTFRPVAAEDPAAHRMDEERYEIGPDCAARIRATRKAGGRVVAVGTTTVRALETAAAEDGEVRPGCGRTDLFIRPPFRFRAADALMTNFHLPRSTLLMLVCAFAGRRRVLAAYRAAVDAGYRFYSYGDAMLLR